MTTIKKSFILYTDTYEAIKSLSLTEKGKLLDSIYEFVISGNEKKLKPETKMAFTFIKTSIVRDMEKWDTIRARNIANGKMGGRPRLNNNPEKPRKPSGLFGNPENPVSVNVNDSVSKKNKDSENPQAVEDFLWSEAYKASERRTS